MSEITYKVEGKITDSKGNSMKFTNKDIVNIEIETGTTKRIINNHSALKLQELVKERIIYENKHYSTSPMVSDVLQSLVEESEKWTQ